MNCWSAQEASLNLHSRKTQNLTIHAKNSRSNSANSSATKDKHEADRGDHRGVAKLMVCRFSVLGCHCTDSSLYHSQLRNGRKLRSTLFRELCGDFLNGGRPFLIKPVPLPRPDPRWPIWRAEVKQTSLSLWAPIAFSREWRDIRLQEGLRKMWTSFAFIT